MKNPLLFSLPAVVNGLRMTPVYFTLALCVSMCTAVSADDTEIFFTRNSGAPNVLFVLDTSGSMDELDGGSKTRLQRMKDALGQLLDKIGDVNVGMMSFTSRSSMGLHEQILPMSAAHKQNMKDSINGLDHDGGTPTLRALWNSTQYFRGELNRKGASGKYPSPITHECQTNHIVLLTDGDPTRDTGTQDTVEKNISNDPDFECLEVDVGGDDDNGTCGVELTDYLLDNDHSDEVDGNNNVITHTIGFNFSENWLSTLSQRGGLHFNAETPESLLTAFDAILQNVSGTFAAPSVSVNAFNANRHSDELYYTFFQPKTTSRWDGNVKKYRLVDGEIVDVNGDALIDANGDILESSRSLWAATADGKLVKDGGMAKLQPQDRNWYTDSGAADIDDNIAVIKVDGDTDTSGLWPVAEERDDLFSFIRGVDVLDQDANNITQEPNHYVADSIHNSPLLVSYRAKAATTGSIAEKSEVVFFANNMGVLHAVDAETGAEKWSYTPQELLPNIKSYMDNEGGDHTYGFDGSLVLHETYKTTTDYDYEIDQAKLYLTQRRGGRGIFALDISNGHSTTDPFKVLWKINGETDSNFSDLGQTWATPMVIPVRLGCPDNCEVTELLMFGGGYNPLYDDKTLTYPVTAPATGHGNAIYLVNPDTGALVWSAGNGTHHKTDLQITHSVPETPVPVDTDADGAVDLLFFSDIGGHVWRLDLNKRAKDGDDLVHSGDMIASLAPVVDDVIQPMRFYNRVDVVIKGTTYSTASFNIVLGSGMRASPLYQEPFANRLYSIRDPWVFNSPVGDEVDANGHLVPNYKYVKDEDNNTRDVITPAVLTEIVDSTTATDTTTVTDTTTITDTTTVADATTATTAIEEPEVNVGFFGFYKEMSATAEKILQPTLTHGGRVFLMSYVPPDPDATVNGCNYHLGESRLQILDLEYGTNLLPRAKRPYIRSGSGIVTNGSIVDTGDSGGPDFVMGVNTEKLVDLLDPDNPNIFRRIFRTGWSELDE